MGSWQSTGIVWCEKCYSIPVRTNGRTHSVEIREVFRNLDFFYVKSMWKPINVFLIIKSDQKLISRKYAGKKRKFSHCETTTMQWWAMKFCGVCMNEIHTCGNYVWNAYYCLKEREMKQWIWNSIPAKFVI